MQNILQAGNSRQTLHYCIFLRIYLLTPPCFVLSSTIIQLMCKHPSYLHKKMYLISHVYSLTLLYTVLFVCLFWGKNYLSMSGAARVHTHCTDAAIFDYNGVVAAKIIADQCNLAINTIIVFV